MLLCLLMCGLLAGCTGADRLLRMTPFWGDDLPDPERVNVWPLYYQTDDVVVVLWPIFDLDSKGFAVRPVITREEEQWTLLFPLSGWNTETDEWWALPAYNLENNHGVFPLWNSGDWHHVALAWWRKDVEGEVTDWGVFPLYGSGELNHVGPVWWKAPDPEKPDKPRTWGVFPLARFAERSGYVVPAWWNKDKNGDLTQITVLPLFHYKKDGSYQRLITPLGGRGWSEDSDKQFVNVLGPLFHRSSSADGKRSYTAVVWPIFTMARRDGQVDVHLLPIFRYRSRPDGRSISALLGLISHTTAGDATGMRVVPLFSYKKDQSMRMWDFFTLYGYGEQNRTIEDDQGNEELRKDVHMHIGTPLLFHYNKTGDKTRWGSLLNVLDYETEGDKSKFAFLYFLYRQQRKGEQVSRDFFPFFTWDSGPERSGFSFLWRLFRWESVGDKTRGHFLFIPWGDHSPNEEPPTSRPR